LAVVHENENEKEKDFKNENGIRTVKIFFKRTKIIASQEGPKAAKPNVICTITLRGSCIATVPSLRCKSGSLFGIGSLAASGNDY
jgi:hypothetical protein